MGALKHESTPVLRWYARWSRLPSLGQKSCDMKERGGPGKTGRAAGLQIGVDTDRNRVLRLGGLGACLRGRRARMGSSLTLSPAAPCSCLFRS